LSKDVPRFLRRLDNPFLHMRIVTLYDGPSIFRYNKINFVVILNPEGEGVALCGKVYLFILLSVRTIEINETKSAYIMPKG
jgi:hypothetical protein